MGINGPIISEVIQCKACGEKDYIELITMMDIVCQSCGNDARSLGEFLSRFIELVEFEGPN